MFHCCYRTNQRCSVQSLPKLRLVSAIGSTNKPMTVTGMKIAVRCTNDSRPSVRLGVNTKGASPARESLDVGEDHPQVATFDIPTRTVDEERPRGWG